MKGDGLRYLTKHPGKAVAAELQGKNGRKVLLGRDYTDDEKVRLLLYLAIGAAAAIIEWGGFYCLNIFFGVNYLAAAAMAFAFSTVCHYALGNIFVFNSGARYRRQKELSLVFLVSTAGLGLNIFLMWLFVGIFLMDAMISKIAASAIVVFWNYLSRKKWIF